MNSLRILTGEFFCGLQGIKSGDQGKFRPDQGIPLSSAIWAFAPADNPIVPTDLEPCREGEQRRRQMLDGVDVGTRGVTPAGFLYLGWRDLRRALTHVSCGAV
jgi:hypothetical protein